MGWDFCQRKRKDTFGLARAESLGLFWFVNLSGVSCD